MSLVSLASGSCCGTGLIACHVSVQFRVLAFLSYLAFLDIKKSLCIQIQEIAFVFHTIKRRVFSAAWKVVWVSGAGHLGQCYTGPGLALEIIFPFRRIEPGGRLWTTVRHASVVQHARCGGGCARMGTQGGG